MNLRDLFFNDSINFKFLYNIPYIKQIIAFFLIPLLAFIIICSIILLAYSNKGVNNIRYKYKANVFSIIISILLTVVFFSILLGFSYAFYKQMTSVGLKTPIAYLVIVSPIIPFIFFISFFRKLIKVMKKKPPKEIDSLEEQNNPVNDMVVEETKEQENKITEEELNNAFKEETPPVKIEENNIEDVINDISKIEDIPTVILDEPGKHEELGKHEKIEYGKHEETEVEDLEDRLDEIRTEYLEENNEKNQEEIELL